MPVQTQQVSLAALLGGRLSQVNAECAGKPLDLGTQRLPAGIEHGVARVQGMTFKVQEKDGGKIPKGGAYFSGTAVCLSPLEFKGVKTAGMQTFFQIPLCDVPGKNGREGSTLAVNFNKFRSLMEALGIKPCMENGQTDPTGVKTNAYWQAAMQSLTDPQRPGGPVYVAFRTRGWTPPKTPQNPNPEPMTFEEWTGAAEFKHQPDPAAGVTVRPETQPGAFEEPPTGVVMVGDHPADEESSDPGEGMEREDEVAMLVEMAMADPNQETEEGAQACRRLEEMAWEAGWSEEQTKSPPTPYSNDWAGVGDMALNPPPPQPTRRNGAPANSSDLKLVAPGGKFKFTRRGKDGSKLKNNKGEELPAQNVVVATVDPGTKTCTVKTEKDGKDVVDIRSKKPVEVRFEWLEPLS